MPACCISYTTDPTYLFPTLVSAIQARAHSAKALADVAIFSINTDPETRRILDGVCAAEGIRFIPVAPEMIENTNAMLSRLFLTRIVPPEYSRFLYIDGDTQIAGSLDPLITADIPRGGFLAASDPMVFELSDDVDSASGIVTYFAKIGISKTDLRNYFNSGVMLIDRDGWEAIGLEAWRLFEAKKALSKFPDQDALNIAGGHARLPMSLAWNFPIFMLNSRVTPQILPRIYHFMGAPKPWHGVFMPWNADVYRPYGELAVKYPELARYWQTMPLNKRVRYFFQQHYKRGFEMVTWGLSNKRGRILEYEQAL